MIGEGMLGLCSYFVDIKMDRMELGGSLVNS